MRSLRRVAIAILLLVSAAVACSSPGSASGQAEKPEQAAFTASPETLNPSAYDAYLSAASSASAAAEQTPDPTLSPTAEPTPSPTQEPTPCPTEELILSSSEEPTPVPTEEPTPSSMAEPSPAETVSSVPSASPKVPMVALTFDDGPTKGYTGAILDLLEKYDARATFFVLGTSIDKTTGPLLQRMVDLNCEIGIHGLDHSLMTRHSFEYQRKRLAKMKSIISDWVEGGYEVRVMRPPGGHQNAAVRRCAAEADLAIILWSVDTMDWKVADSGKIMKTCQSKIRNGSIVLMHDKLKATRSALSKLIPYLQEKGFQLVTVSELLESSGSPLESGVVYRSKGSSSK